MKNHLRSKAGKVSRKQSAPRSRMRFLSHFLPDLLQYALADAGDTVPRYLATGKWDPHATVATLSNAMDVSKPNNWPRVEELFRVKGWNLAELGYGKLSDAETREAMKETHAKGYITEPHGAIAYKVLQNNMEAGDTGIFLCTAAPAKFKESVDEILGIDLPLPEALASRADLRILSDNMDADFAVLRKYLLKK